MRGRRGDETGLIAVIVAVFALVMFGLAALVVDLGVAREKKRDAQKTVDAAALAGAGELYSDSGALQAAKAITAVKQYAAANGTPVTAWPSCRAARPPGYSRLSRADRCILVDSRTHPTKVYVVLPPRDSPAFFGGVAGFGGTTISTLAEATVEEKERQVACAFCVLGAGPHNLQNGDLAATGAPVWFNGDVDLSANGHVASDKGVYVEGSTTSPDNVTPPPHQGAGPVEDPLGATSLPAIPSGYPTKTQPCGTTAANGPGVYFIIAAYTTTCTLQPGLYVVATPVQVPNGVTVNASAGVTIYFVCKSGATVAPCSSTTSSADRGSLEVAGAMTVAAPSSGATKGLAIVYDRNNTSQLAPGDQSLTVTGTIYGQSVTMTAGGNDCATQRSLIVVRSVALNGNGACLKTVYSPAQNVAQPLGPAGLGLSK